MNTLASENAVLREQVRVLNALVRSQADRIAAQSELLAQRAVRKSAVADDRRQWDACHACKGSGSADSRDKNEGMFCIACNGTGTQT